MLVVPKKIPLVPQIVALKVFFLTPCICLGLFQYHILGYIFKSNYIYVMLHYLTNAQCSLLKGYKPDPENHKKHLKWQKSGQHEKQKTTVKCLHFSLCTCTTKINAQSHKVRKVLRNRSIVRLIHLVILYTQTFLLQTASYYNK